MSGGGRAGGAVALSPSSSEASGPGQHVPEERAPPPLGATRGARVRGTPSSAFIKSHLEMDGRG